MNNNSQLAGFTKKGSIEFFVERLTRLTYMELPAFAPDQDMFREYRKEGDWELYESRYIGLLERRSAAECIERAIIEQGVILLCSERTAERCHRRLAAEYLRVNGFPEVEILHL